MPDKLIFSGEKTMIHLIAEINPTLLSGIILSICTIIAIILGPILAVQIERDIAKRGDEKKKKEYIFSILMATRSTPLNLNHVEALNLIDITFYNDQKVRNSRKLLWDHFRDYPQDVNSETYQAEMKACQKKSQELLVDLLYEIAISLNYNFDKVMLKNESYLPQGHADDADDLYLIRKGVLSIIADQRSIPVHIKEPATNDHTSKDDSPAPSS